MQVRAEAGYKGRQGSDAHFTSDSLHSSLPLRRRGALKAVNLLRAAAACVAVVAAVGCLLSAWLPLVAGAHVMLAALAGAAWALLGRLRNQFLFVDYVHAQK